MSQAKQKMSKSSKVLTIIIASILGAVAVSFLILAFIPVYGFNRAPIKEYDYVNIYNVQHSSTPLTAVLNVNTQGLTEEQAKLAKLLDDGIKSTQYSALRAALEFNYIGHMRLETYVETVDEPVWDEDTGFQKKDDDGELMFESVETVQHTQVKSGEIVPATTPNAERFVLEFVYSTIQSIDVTDKDGNIVTLTYDAMRVGVYDSNNTISEFKMYFYERGKLFADTPEAADETIPVVLVRANTSNLYDNLTEIQDSLK